MEKQTNASLRLRESDIDKGGRGKKSDNFANVKYERPHRLVPFLSVRRCIEERLFVSIVSM